MTSSRVVPIVILAAAAPLACSPKAEAPASSSAALRPGSDSIAAEVEGRSITLAEVDERARPRLARVRQEEYEIRRDALDELIDERLREAEAKKRGISVEELHRKEVVEKATTPPAELVESIYSRNHDRFAGSTKEAALARISELLVERAEASRQAEFGEELRAGKTIDVRLDPPRVEVAIPASAPTMGAASAPVTIVEFTDYQCPFCHRAQSTIEEVLKRYEGKVRFVHLDFPLDSHPGAVPAARAARCAGQQGRFWEYHKSLMSSPGSLDTKDLTGRAARLNLDGSRFAACIGSDDLDDAIRSDLEQGAALGVTGTPAYFINGRMISGARPLETFTTAIDAELARKDG